jgi:transcriptional regulator with XRE-family HTH domain
MLEFVRIKSTGIVPQGRRSPMSREPREELIPIGLRLKVARENMGYSQQQVRLKLAERDIEITQSGYSHWETGRAELSISALKAICEILKTDAGYLLGQAQEDIWVREPSGRRYYGLEPHQQSLINALMEEMAASDREETTHGRKAQ